MNLCDSCAKAGSCRTRGVNGTTGCYLWIAGGCLLIWGEEMIPWYDTYRVSDCFCDKCGAEWIEPADFNLVDRDGEVWPHCPVCNSWQWRAKKKDRDTCCPYGLLFVYEDGEIC